MRLIPNELTKSYYQQPLTPSLLRPTCVTIACETSPVPHQNKAESSWGTQAAVLASAHQMVVLPAPWNCFLGSHQIQC